MLLKDFVYRQLGMVRLKTNSIIINLIILKIPFNIG